MRPNGDFLDSHFEVSPAVIRWVSRVSQVWTLRIWPLDRDGQLPFVCSLTITNRPHIPNDIL